MTDLTHLLQFVPVRDIAKDEVVQRLREPHRRYHNLDHVLEMWSWHNLYHPEASSDEQTIVACFCLYHDAIYNPQAIGDSNEQRSADLWLLDSDGIVTQATRTAVDTIIYASCDHFRLRCLSREDNIHAYLSWCLDLDLLRLASSPDRFIQHGRDIRAEYTHLTDLQWLKMSAAFRAKAMAQSAIFFFADFAEPQARQNLARTLLHDWQQLGYL